MRLIRYLALRRQGFTEAAAASLSSECGDKLAGIVTALVLVWLLTDSLGLL